VNEIAQTNLTLPDIVGLLPIALNLDPARIQTLNLIRTYHTTPWQPPDGSYVQLPNWSQSRSSSRISTCRPPKISSCGKARESKC
jgi:hypothetical protein